MNVLVTGGSGLIGYYVVQDLLTRGHSVTVFDKFKPAFEVPWVKGDILHPNHTLPNAIFKSDAVIHLASAIGVANTDRNALLTLDTILTGTRTVVGLVGAEKKLIFASTSEVYGDCPVIPIREDCPVSPKSVYAAAKLAAEYMVRTHPHHTVLRFFNVYGPRQNPEFVLPKFVKRAVAELPIEVYGDGGQTRAFCHAADVASGVCAALSDKADDQIYNLGNPYEPISMFDLATKIVERAGSKSPVVKTDYSYSDRRIDRDIQHRVPDIGKAFEQLDYRVYVNLNRGIDETIEYYKANS